MSEELRKRLDRPSDASPWRDIKFRPVGLLAFWVEGFFGHFWGLGLLVFWVWGCWGVWFRALAERVN